MLVRLSAPDLRKFFRFGGAVTSPFVWLEPDRLVQNPGVTGCIDGAIITGLRVFEKQRIRHQQRIEPFADQPLLLLLEGIGRFEGRAKSDKDGTRIRWQTSRKPLAKFNQ